MRVGLGREGTVTHPTLELQVDLKSTCNDGSVRIGEAAARLGVATHVLRHWEDERVVIPLRSSSGHRDYAEEHLQRLRIVKSCQRLGLSLPEIRQILHRDEPGRVAVIDRRVGEIRRLRAELDMAERFLGHVRECRHDFITRCTECSAYAGTRGEIGSDA
ncbi:MerR family transcriptional regulator [Microbacterium halotolerans]|uniref:MerR family transcriptional regulator n=1 Tax=Microbacterium halotolerans TaxID=246613 RepID=UPI003B849699